MNKTQRDNPLMLWLVAAWNGAGIMAFELIAGKMFAPFFGAGTDAWAVVLGVMMLGLAIGYRLGGIWAIRNPRPEKLGILLGFLSLFALLSPLLARLMFGFTYLSFGFAGGILSAVVVILPFTLVAGMISPALMHYLVTDVERSGRTAGNVFALSTLCGVLATYLFGFFLIPGWGMAGSIALVGGLYLLSAMPLLLRTGGLWRFAGLIPALIILLNVFLPSENVYKGLLYRESGLHGELLVADIPLDWNGQRIPRRMMLNNRIGQTNMNIETGKSLWPYAHYLATLSGGKPRGSRALLLGLAGGNIANELLEMGYTVDAVDLDPRAYSVARDFFGLRPEVRFVEDDARHYLNVTEQTYDVIIMDLFSGEGFPAHVLTLESLDRIKSVLNEGGRFLVNTHGFVKGDPGKGTRSLYKTLDAAGLHPLMLFTPGTELERNTLILGQEEKPVPGQLHFSQNPCCKAMGAPLNPDFQLLFPDAMADAYVLTDEYPFLEQLNRHAMRAWREYAIEHYLLGLQTEGIPYF